MPDEEGFIHTDYVDQDVLSVFYNKADVFCLPSREDGFGVVLMQAISCGLYLVCSDRTGGPDILEVLDDRNAVRIFKSGNIGELTEGLESALKAALKNKPNINLLGDKRPMFSWETHSRSLVSFVDNQRSIGLHK